jgi:hypothetical protein
MSDQKGKLKKPGPVSDTVKGTESNRPDPVTHFRKAGGDQEYDPPPPPPPPP